MPKEPLHKHPSVTVKIDTMFVRNMPAEENAKKILVG
jgi:hypothetical protein